MHHPHLLHPPRYKVQALTLLLAVLLWPSAPKFSPFRSLTLSLP